MSLPDPSERIEDDPSYHSHKPGERRFSEDPVVFPEKMTEDCEPPKEEDAS